MATDRTADLKLVLVGDAGVGKTALVNRYVHAAFSPDSVATIGASFALKERAGLLVAVWDTAGAERYGPLTSFYLRRADAALVVADCSNIASFARAEHFWEKVLEESPECAMVFVWNKIDLCPKGNSKELVERAKALTAEHPKATGYFEVSAKSGQGVTEAFDHAVFLARPNEFDPAIASSDPVQLPTERGTGLHVDNNQHMAKKTKCCE